MSALATQEAMHAWELRTHWALGTEVVAVLDPALAEIPRVRGLVVRVAPTGAVVWFDDGSTGRDGAEITVPVVAIVNLRRPNYEEDGSAPRRRGVLKIPEQIPGQFSLWEEPDGQLLLAGEGGT